MFPQSIFGNILILSQIKSFFKKIYHQMFNIKRQLFLVYILAIRCYAQIWLHSVFLQALKKQRYYNAMVIYHCIRWYRMHVIRIHLVYYLINNQANRMYHGTWHYWYRCPLCVYVCKLKCRWVFEKKMKRKGTERKLVSRFYIIPLINDL